MKKKIIPMRVLFYIFTLFVLVFVGLEYYNINIVRASGSCCNFGVDCPEGKGRDPILKCCKPQFNEAPCSQAKPNYCRENCI